jgi:hypothetical protein
MDVKKPGPIYIGYWNGGIDISPLIVKVVTKIGRLFRSVGTKFLSLSNKLIAQEEEA